MYKKNNTKVLTNVFFQYYLMNTRAWHNLVNNSQN